VTATYLRYCPDCGEEYQPHMTQCLDCGTALKEKLDGEKTPELNAPPEPEPVPTLPPGDYAKVADGLTAQTVEPLVKLFVSEKLPVKVESHGYGLSLSARREDRAAVVAILEREGVIPKHSDDPAVAAEGGPCPACGTPIKPGTVECGECGLLLGAFCEGCGEALSPTDDTCAACGRTLD
jgi:hypothetical protein